MIGSVSHGTLQPRDLIPAFISALEDVSPDAHLTVTSRWEDVIARAEATSWEQVCDDDERVYCGDPVVDHLLDDLFQALDGAAPEGTYFGATEGDGSDFGFWQIEEVDA